MVKFVFVVVQGNALCYTEVKRTKYKILCGVFIKYILKMLNKKIS